MDKSKYPANWKAISKRIRFDRAKGRCEGTPMYPDCQAVNNEPHPETGSTVMLTVAHLDHDTTNNCDGNLRALCQRCHLAWDARYHARNAAETRRQKRIEAGQLHFLPICEVSE